MALRASSVKQNLHAKPRKATQIDANLGLTAFRIVQCAALVFSRESSVNFSSGMPADEGINGAIVGALQATNGGFQPTTATPAIVMGDTAALVTKATRYTLLRDNSQANPVYSYTTGEVAKPFGAAALKAWQIGVQKTGTAIASTWLKPADYADYDAVRGVLTIGASA